MRKVIYWVHASLDGHINGPNGDFDWPVLGPELAAYSEGMNDRVDTFLYGRAVWDMMSAFWPQAESMSNDEHDLKFAPIWRATPKIVFSRTLEKADWNTRVISGNIAEAVTGLKQQPGKDLLLTGGSGLAATLTELGLIDEYTSSSTRCSSAAASRCSGRRRIGSTCSSSSRGPSTPGPCSSATNAPSTVRSGLLQPRTEGPPPVRAAPMWSGRTGCRYRDQERGDVPGWRLGCCDQEHGHRAAGLPSRTCAAGMPRPSRYVRMTRKGKAMGWQAGLRASVAEW